MAAPTLSRPKYPTPLYLNSPKDRSESPRNDNVLEPLLNMFERANSFPLEQPHDASRRITASDKSPTVDDHAAPGSAQDTASLGSASPSPPIEIQTTTSAPTFPHSLSAPHSQEHFDNSNHHHAFGAKVDNYLPPSSDRYIRNTSGIEHSGADNKYPPSFPSHSLLDQRRMSEPSIFGSSGSSHHSAYPNPGAEPSAGRYQQMQFAFNPPPLSPRSPYIHRAGSLRDLTHPHHLSNPWKGTGDMHLHNLTNGLHLDEPVSPLHPNFSSGTHSPTLGMPPSGYPPIGEDSYGQSPPGTGTSTTSSNAPANRNIGTANSGSSSSSKTYSFVALPGNAVKKRPRRRYDEIERLYQCSWPDCAKAYGTLNHLNAHVTMQKHGVKRNPNEFKELRKQWRKAKKEDEANRAHSVHHHHHSSRRPDMIDADLYPHHHQPPSHHRHHHHHHPYHHASQLHNVSVPALGPDGRFSAMPIGDIRYPADELDGLPRGHGAEDAFRRGSHPDLPIRSHSRYRSTSGPGGWHSTVVSSRPANHYLGSGLPSNADIALNRLGPESTLLTPLPGYEPHHSLVSADGALNNYGGYGAGYDDDGRPDSGHRSLYSESRPGTGHRSMYDDGRPRTGSAYDDRPNTGHSLYDDRPGTGNGSERGEFRHM